jgi:hypothetical protein
MWATSIEIKWTWKEQEDFYSGTFLATSPYFTKTDISWPNWSNNYAVRLCINIIEWKQNCTGRATLNSNWTSMSESAIIWLKRASAGFKLECETAMKQFLWFGCQDENLVAYAPYDNSWDLYMYTASPTVDNKRLEPRTNGVASTKYDWESYFKSDSIDLDGNTSNENIFPYYNNTQILNNTVNLWNLPSSFMSMVSWERWVVINYWSEQDYMKYDLSKLSLGDSFSIEMSVRGGALKRPSGSFYLFNLWNLYLHLDTWTTTRLKTWYSTSPLSGFQDLEQILLSSLNNLDNNKFYKVSVVYNNSRPKIYIYDWSNKILESSLINNSNIPSWIRTDLFIWSQLNSANQWNDIIDYVKIYK